MDQCNLFNAVNNNDAFYLQEVLIDYPDIDVNQALIASLTALHIAAEKGYSSCVTMLIAAGTLHPSYFQENSRTVFDALDLMTPHQVIPHSKYILTINIILPLLV